MGSSREGSAESRVLQGGMNNVGLRGWIKGMAQMELVVDCSKARALLSDLLDVRRGEQPAPIESPLGHPLTLQAMELHVGKCAACQQELRELEELGLAFSDFSVDEPQAAHFTGYGQKVNKRIRRMPQHTTVRAEVVPVSPWRTWLSTVTVSAAAAVLTAVLLGLPGQTTQTEQQKRTPIQVQPARQQASAERKSVIIAHDPTPYELLADAERIDVPTLEPCAQTLNLMTSGEGSRLVTYDPSVDKKTPVIWLPEKKTFFLGDSTAALVGIMFKATGDEDPAGGLYVVAVKRGGPADVIGLRPDNRLLALNGVSFSGSSSEEILKFFNAASNLGKGKSIQIDYATQSKSGEWIVKRGRAVLGKFD